MNAGLLANKILSNFPNDDENVKKFMFKEICQCYNQCFTLDENRKKEYKINENDKDIVCNKIVPSNNNPDFYLNLIDTIISYMSKKYIKELCNKYYISYNNLNIKLSWENIKNLENTNVKEMFWLFRKIIVDSILKSIILKNNILDVRIYSVGSSTLTSDYDITLYDDNILNSNDSNDKIFTIINEFQNIFHTLFTEHSSIVFDTNIYGKAYITFNCGKSCSYLYERIKCMSQKEAFFTLKSVNNNKLYKSIQVSWSIIKFLRNLKDSLGDSIYTTYFSYLKNKVSKNQDIETQKEYFSKIQKMLLYLTNNDFTYTDLIYNEEKYKKLYKDYFENIQHFDTQEELVFYNDYISFVNFYGEETYFSRGAFLDTVVNSQMCNDTVVKLYEDDYIASIFENAGFYLLHSDKVKYLKRVLNSVEKLVSLNKNSIYKTLFNKNFNKMKNVVNNEKNYCNWINENDINLLKCEKFNMYNSILILVSELIQIFIFNNDVRFVPYYDIIVQNNMTKTRVGIVQNNLVKTNSDIFRPLKFNNLLNPPKTNSTFIQSLKNSINNSLKNSTINEQDDTSSQPNDDNSVKNHDDNNSSKNHDDNSIKNSVTYSLKNHDDVSSSHNDDDSNKNIRNSVAYPLKNIRNSVAHYSPNKNLNKSNNDIFSHNSDISNYVYKTNSSLLANKSNDGKYAFDDAFDSFKIHKNIFNDSELSNKSSNESNSSIDESSSNIEPEKKTILLKK